MKISKVRIDGFGKFIKRDFSFQSGLNVIFGPNESGKTTLANFILYTLSGFSLEEVERYRPWAGEELSGKLSLETRNGEKVELELDPSNPSEERYLKRIEYELCSYVPEESGLDLRAGVDGVMIAKLKKRMEEMEKVERIVEILNMNHEIYEKMREVEIELEERLENLREELGKLEERFEEEKRLRRRYVENKRKLRDLQGRLEDLERELLASRIVKAKSTWREMDRLRIEISNLGVEISKLKKYTKIDPSLLDRVRELENEIEGISKKMEDLKNEVEEKEREEKELQAKMEKMERRLGIKSEADSDRIDLKIKNLKLVLRMYKEKIAEIGTMKDEWKVFEDEESVRSKMANLEEILKDMREMEEELERYREEMRELNEKIESISRKISLRNVLAGMLIGIAAALSSAGLYLQQVMWFGIGAGGLAGVALAVFLSVMELRRRRYTLEDEFTRNELNVRVLERKLDSSREELRRELSELGFESFERLKREFESFKRWKEKVKEKFESDAIVNLENELRNGLKEFYGEVIGDYEPLIDELERLLSEYKSVKDRYDLVRLSKENALSRMEDLEVARSALENELRGLLDKLECETVEDCGKIDSGIKRYEELNTKRERLEARLRDLRTEWEKLKTYFDMEIPEGIDEEKIEQEEIISSKMENVRLEISETEKRILELIGRIKEVEVKPEEYFSKVEEISDLETRLEKVSNEMRMFPEVITLLSDIKEEFIERYRDVFEERLNEIVSKLGLRELTIGVRDDLSLEIAIVGGKGGLSSLSRATRDQIELVYRIALHDVLSPSDPYPLVIDNALVRYDDDRLKRTVEFLRELSKERQVILTTSDSRVLNLVPKRIVKSIE